MKYCTCYSNPGANKVCTVGCGCNCHHTGNFLQEQYKQWIAHLNSLTVSMSPEEVDKIKFFVEYEIPRLRELMANMQDMVEWYKRIKDM